MTADSLAVSSQLLWVGVQARLSGGLSLGAFPGCSHDTGQAWVLV